MFDGLWKTLKIRLSAHTKKNNNFCSLLMQKIVISIAVYWKSARFLCKTVKYPSIKMGALR